MSGKADLTRQEEFKRATAGTLRAIAHGNAEVQVAFQPGPSGVAGKRVRLPLPTRALIAAGGQPLGPNELLRRVWGYTTPGDHAVVSSMITRIQRRLEHAGGADLLALEHAGYRLALPAR